MTKRGNWVTAVSGDGVGFFDLVLIKAPRVIFAELKSVNGRTTQAQKDWFVRTSACPGVAVYLWRPTDIEAIERILK